QLMLSGRNVFLTGKAGTGKSTVLHRFREQAGRNVVFLAPTGLAALNIGGMTIHRFLGLPPVDFFPAGYVPSPGEEQRRLIGTAECVVVDEISMVRSDLFQVLCDTLASLPLPGHEGRPLGGRQLVVSGDFFQLSPVVPDDGTEDRLLGDHFGAYAFHSLAWTRTLFHTAWLDQPHRQGADQAFVTALDVLRRGRGSDELADCLGWINRHATVCAPPREATVLCAYRRDAAAINRVRDAELDSPLFRHDAQVTGDFPSGDWPADFALEFRIGSRVMLLANCEGWNGPVYANGDTGTVVGWDARQSAARVVLDSGAEVAVEPHPWLNNEYTVTTDEHGRPAIETTTVGTFTQLPLRLAYAITIHKAQGMGLERAHLNLGRGAFACGQTYTALSRVRSLAGLSLDRQLLPCDIIAAPAVLDFHDCLVNEAEFDGFLSAWADWSHPLAVF
ncbi:MAG: AAA family ATPase, partial [Lentisphaeria bacterium]|nr:AAA family ATPase [Lentisphaeria bacterium]